MVNFRDTLDCLTHTFDAAAWIHAVSVHCSGRKERKLMKTLRFALAFCTLA